MYNPINNTFFVGFAKAHTGGEDISTMLEGEIAVIDVRTNTIAPAAISAIVPDRISHPFKIALRKKINDKKPTPDTEIIFSPIIRDIDKNTKETLFEHLYCIHAACCAYKPLGVWDVGYNPSTVEENHTYRLTFAINTPEITSIHRQIEYYVKSTMSVSDLCNVLMQEIRADKYLNSIIETFADSYDALVIRERIEPCKLGKMEPYYRPNIDVSLSMLDDNYSKLDEVIPSTRFNNKEQGCGDCRYVWDDERKYIYSLGYTGTVGVPVGLPQNIFPTPMTKDMYKYNFFDIQSKWPYRDASNSFAKNNVNISIYVSNQGGDTPATGRAYMTSALGSYINGIA